MNIEFNLSFDLKRFASLEDILVRVEVINHTPVSISVPVIISRNNPSPLFHLSGPETFEPVLFCPAGIATEKAKKVALGDYPEKIILKPGKRYAEILYLNRILNFDSPGAYTLRASFPCEIGDVKSNSVDFSLDDGQCISLAMANRRGQAEALDLQACWLYHGKKLHLLFNGLYSDAGREVTQVESFMQVRAAEVGPDASAPPSLLFNTFAQAGQINWNVWLEKEKLCATAHVLRKNIIGLPLPSGAHRIVSSALVLPDQDLDVFVLGLDDNCLRLVRFGKPVNKTKEMIDALSGEELEEEPEEEEDEEEEWSEEEEEDLDPADFLDDYEAPEPQILWEQQLEDAPQGITATLGPSEAGSERRIAYTVQREDGAEVFVANFKSADEPAAFSTLLIPKTTLLPATAPGLAVDAKGTSQVAVLYTMKSESENAEEPHTDSQRDLLFLAEMQFDSEGKFLLTQDIKVLKLCALESHVQAGAIAYFIDDDEEGPPRSDCVVLLENDRLVGRILNRGFQSFEIKNELVRPLQLTSLADEVLIAEIDATTGPRLEPLS